MITVPTKKRIINLETGETTEESTQLYLMPPDPAACQICGRNPPHDPDEPHDAQSLYYQYAFYGQYGRWPTWKDAVAHCSEKVKRAWERELRAAGHWTEPEELMGKKHVRE